MARPLKELGTPGAFEPTCEIRPPTTKANDFEIRLALMQLIVSHPFCGIKHESPHNHLKEFEKYCDTIKVNGASQEDIRIKLFKFSLRGKAMDWLDKEVKTNSLTSWQEVTLAFLQRFHPRRMMAEACAKIQGFHQNQDETLYDTWERFKECQRERPHHGIPKWLFYQTFYVGLYPSSKMSLDAGGSIMNRNEDEIEDIF